MQIPLKLLRKNEENFSISSEEIADKRRRINTNDATGLDSPDQVLKRRNMLKSVAPEELDLAFERYIGNNDLLPINYLEMGNIKSKAIGRIRYFDVTTGRNALATGFLISPDLILTNHHVLQQKDSFSNAYIEFDYAFDIDGREKPKITFALDPDKFFYTCENLDFSLTGISSNDETQNKRVEDRGFIVLNPNLGKIGMGDCATIIQYPDGNWQQIALRDNRVLDISKPEVLIYSTDTSNGSSGAAVFNDQWQVIALHSAGVAKKNDQGKYIDENGNEIAEINGTIDSSKIVWIANTGIRISSIMNQLFTDPVLSGNDYISFLKNKNYSDAKTRIAASPALASTETCIQKTSSQPLPMKTQNQQPLPGIIINITIGGVPQPLMNVPAAAASVADTESKADDESDMDYSQCTGFDEYFMGFKTPLPALGAKLKRKIAFFTENPNKYVLKYYHYSTIQHAIRKMPVISVINIDGDPATRQDNAARKDKWLRDNRIDLALQLTDEYYKNSHFDKGHMSRREDAKWGDSAEDAEESANLTCMYTNACPQVPDINRAVYGKHGLWGQLEQIVLEKGVKNEPGKSSKICVYNGPVFTDTDPVYKGVQVPLRFFKIIVWLNAAGAKKTTCFILSQEDLVGGIQFEDLHFDKEFKEHQCSITYLEGLTALTFDEIREYDTYNINDNQGHEAKIMTTDDLNQLIDKHAS